MLVTLNYVSRSIQCNDETWCNPMPRMCVYFFYVGKYPKNICSIHESVCMVTTQAYEGR